MNDITLNGVGYTVVPGSYRKRSAVSVPREVRRLEVGPFGAGQRRAFGTEGDRESDGDAWDGLAVGPCFDGQGIEPFPDAVSFVDASILDTPSAGQRAYGVVAGNNAFIGIGRRIYKSVALSNGTWAAFTAAADLGAGFTISGLAYFQDDLLVMLSSGQDIRKFNTTSNALTIWRTGEKGQVGCGYAGQKR
jgi:hypothetical protein